MKVKVEYLGSIRVTLNKKEEIVEIPLKTTLEGLLGGLSSAYGKWFMEEVFEPKDKKVRDGLIVTVNGIAAGQTGGLRTVLREGDVVSILPFFAGGG